jgi:hypothetical protein
VPSFEVGQTSGESSSIQFNSSQEIQGARIYFFVVPHGDPAPSFPFSEQPATPPDYPYLDMYVELTEKVGQRPVVDLSTVDGFSFPATLTINGNGPEVGQPLASQDPSMTRQSILAEYPAWVASHASEGTAPYGALELPAQPNADGQSGGILNPYSYLHELLYGAVPANPTSPLNTVFDSALESLFTSSGWSVNVLNPAASSYQPFTATPFTNVPYASSGVGLSGLQFQNGNTTYDVFNPLGVNDFLTADGQPITLRPVPGSSTQFVLNGLPPASFPLGPGLYVFGPGIPTTNAKNAETTASIEQVGQNASGQTVLTLHFPSGTMLQHTPEQVVISRLPYVGTMQLSSGAMVFGGAGFFADGALQGLTGNAQTLLNGIENVIDEALNRGVAALGISHSLQPGKSKNVTNYWGKETHWYPAGQPQNLFAEFLHTADVSGQPIYVLPPNATHDAKQLVMGQAYGFSFDESPGIPTDQPNVPSKFEPVPPQSQSITVTLDPWFQNGPLPPTPPGPGPGPGPDPGPSLTTPTRVVSVERVGYHARPTSLVVAFNTPLDAASAEDLANYRLTVAGQARPIPLIAATYDAATETVTLQPNRLLPLRRRYELTVVGTPPGGVKGADGQFLDGGEGQGGRGSNYVTTITRRNLTFGPRRSFPDRSSTMKRHAAHRVVSGR